MNFFSLPAMKNTKSNYKGGQWVQCPWWFARCVFVNGHTPVASTTTIPLKTIHSNELKLDEMLQSDQNQKRTIKFVKKEREIDFYATKLHVIKF